MGEHSTFNIKSFDELTLLIEKLDVNIPLSSNIEVLKRRVKLGRKELPNSMVIHPMEGADGTYDGKPGELTIRRYERFARGGAGLLWVEASAIVNEGRANPRQLYLSKENLDDFKKLQDIIKKAAHSEFGTNHNPYTVIQLTHSGRYSRPEGKPAPVIAVKNPWLDKNIPGDYPTITDEELERLEDSFVRAAQMSKEAGFDAVDIKSCHGYLLSELLSAYTREGKYGGSFENRTRFVRNVVDKIKDRLGDSIDITLRMNAYDAVPYPYGWGVDKDDHHYTDLSEPIELLKIFEGKGIKLVNITVANPYYNPHVGRPYDSGPYIPMEHPLKGIERILGVARDIQLAVPDMSVIATGFSWLREFAPYIAAGGMKKDWFKMVGFGRQGFAYPDFAKDIMEKGFMDKRKSCIACSKCTEIMRDGGESGCVIRDQLVYAPIYRKGREGKTPLTGEHLAEHI